MTAFSEFTRFGMPWSRFTYFQKMTLCLRQKFWILLFKTNKHFYEILHLVSTWRKFVSVNFWRKSFIRWCCCDIFPIIFRVLRTQLLLHGIAQNFKCKILALKKHFDMIYVDIAHKGTLLCYFLFFFYRNKIKLPFS